MDFEWPDREGNEGRRKEEATNKICIHAQVTQNVMVPGI